jgi:hypothetical protein
MGFDNPTLGRKGLFLKEKEPFGWGFNASDGRLKHIGFKHFLPKDHLVAA